MQPTREFRFPELTVTAAVITDPGCVRSNNEDNGVHVHPFVTEDRPERGSLTIVADGMGGHSSGEIASSMAVDSSRSYLQRAVALQPSNPRAFQLLGFMSLYGEKNFEEAEANWKKAISLGGAAVLRLTHDHDGSFLKTCQGSLYISRNVVRFESDNNEHTFETTDANIKSIDVNNKWRRMFQLKQGSFKISLKREEKSNYSFAPVTGKTDESKMIIRLIGKRS